MKTPKQSSLKIVVAFFLIFSTNYVTCQTGGWHKAGSNPNDYHMGIDTEIKHQGNASIKISSISQAIDGFGTYMQTFRADKYHGKKIELSAWIKTDNANSAHMWMRFDGQKGNVGFDNMDDRPITGTTDWKQYSIVLDVPEETVNIAFGTFVHGTGTAWVDDYSFGIIGTYTPDDDAPEVHQQKDQKAWQELLKKPQPSDPINLNGED